MQTCIPWVLLVLVTGEMARGAGMDLVQERFTGASHRFAARGEVVRPWQVHEMAQVGDRAYAIVWRPDGRDASLVASTELGRNEWKYFEVPGWAHLLDQPEAALCAIREGEGHLWNITLYDMQGAEKRRIVQPYSPQPHEYLHFLPYPVGVEDGSLALACSYYYETRHPLLLIPMHLLSGGHGSKPKTAWYLDVVESARPAAKMPTVRLESFEDADYKRILIRASHTAGSDSRPTRELKKGRYAILEYEHAESAVRCFVSGSQVICCDTEGAKIFVRGSAAQAAPLPSWMREHDGRPWEGPVAFAETWRDPALDMKLDDQGNLYCAVNCWRASGELELYLLTYSTKFKTWEKGLVTRLLAVDGFSREYPDNVNAVRLLMASRDIYIGLWYGKEPFTAIHIAKPE